MLEAIELIEHNVFAEWFKKWILCLATFFFSKFQDFEFFVWFGFSSNSPNEHVLS
jgi:hypothetical protein